MAVTAALALTLLADPAARAASRRLSQGLPGSDVAGDPFGGGIALSPDGRYAVYTQDAVVDEAYELWSVPLAGGDPVRLSGLLPAGTGVDLFAITADSTRVVYLAPQETAEALELYSIPIAGPEGAWTKLNAPLGDGGAVGYFEIAPGSGRVVYLASDTASSGVAWWTVPTAGGTALRLRPTVSVSGSEATVALPHFAAGGARVLFLANFGDLTKDELWSAPTSGLGTVFKVSRSLVAGGDVKEVTVSPDGATVVYRADALVDGRDELWSAPVAGGASAHLNGALAAGGDVSPDFMVTADGTRVVYLADEQTDEVSEVFSVALDGGPVVKLNPPLVAGGDASYLASSPDGSRVVFSADADSDGVFELWSAPAAGGAPVKISAPMVAGGDVAPGYFEFTADGARVVYMADQETDGIDELFAVAPTGGAVVRLSDPTARGTARFRLSPSGPFVFYLAETDAPGRFELFRASTADGPEPDARLNGELVAGGSLGAPAGLLFDLHPDGRRAIYVADQEVAGRVDLYLGDVCILCDDFESGDFARWH